MHINLVKKRQAVFSKMTVVKSFKSFQILSRQVYDFYFFNFPKQTSSIMDLIPSLEKTRLEGGELSTFKMVIGNI